MNEPKGRPVLSTVAGIEDFYAEVLRDQERRWHRIARARAREGFFAGAALASVAYLLLRWVLS